MKLPPALLRLNERYNAFSPRERRLLAAAIVLAPALVVYNLFLDPLFVRTRTTARNVVQQTQVQADLMGQVSALQEQLRIDPDAGAKAELAELKAEQARLEDELRTIGSTLGRPEEMNGLLETLLKRQPGLHLISLKTLPPQSVLPVREAGADKVAGSKPEERSFDLFRHGVEIRLEGNYGELQAYLVQLESLKQRLLWGSLRYKVIEYPRAEMSLMVYTLGSDKTWLAL